MTTLAPLNPTRQTYVRGSSVYVGGPIQDSGGADLSGLTVQLAIHSSAAEDVTTWLPATIANGAVRTTSPVLLDSGDYPSSEYSVTAKVTNGAETPYVRLGIIVLKD